MAKQHPNQNTQITILPSSWRRTKYNSGEEGQINKVVRESLLLKRDEPYMSAKVKVKRDQNGSPRALVVYMLRRNTYTADIVKLSVDTSYGVQTESEALPDDFEDDEEQPSVFGVFDVGTTDFVCASPVASQIPTAKAAVESVYQTAINAGLHPIKLVDSNATTANYKRYLTGKLKGFVSVGHGWSGGIVLDDGALTAQWVQTLTAGTLSPEVVYLNSCQVFNPPFQPAMMEAGTRTFISGIESLEIGSSEEVCKCFWIKVLVQRNLMGSAISTCEQSHYPRRGAHGISGDTGLFSRRMGHLLYDAYLHWCGRGCPLRDDWSDWFYVERARKQQIQEAAYFRWLGRGRPNRDDWADWFSAEASVDAAFLTRSTSR